MQLDKAEVLLIEQNTDNFLIQYLQKTQKPLVRDEIQNLNQLSESMKNIGAALCLPMVISNKLIGIIVLGNKVSGDAYTKEDLELLTTLSKQAAIALDNARLYKEVQDFSKTLQQKVDEQTKDIKEAYEIEKQAKEDLEKTDEVKNQFMAIANHHLRTPLTAINWYIDLILSGKYGKVSVKLKDIINRINISTTDEIKIVDDLLNVSQFQLGKEIIEANQKVNIEKMFSQIKENEEPEIQQKNIFIKINKLNEIPLIPADESKLKVALANIVDNAVKYTEKGGVTITLEIEKFKNLKITVRDTGMGMNETELENIFIKTFERGTEAQKLFATGKGIGLYLSAKIIEAHHGKIWAESAGKNKGSAFHIELPA
jgi:signal transduction histidine kinase